MPEELSETVRYERRARDLLQAVALAVGSSAGVEGAFQAAMDAVCAHTGWPVGHCYVSGPDGVLASSRLWSLADPARFEDFRKVSEESRFPAGVGLPGRVLHSGHRAWITDVRLDENFPRARLFDGGIGAGFAFPVRVSGRVSAVLEFFSDSTSPPDAALLEVMDTLGLFVGQVVERRELERALVDSELKFRSVTESAQDAMVAADGNGNVLFWNPSAARMFGFSADAMLGQSLERIIPERYREQHRAGMARFRAVGQGRTIGRAVELAGLRADGTEFPLELSLGHWRAGDRNCFTAILRDITERRVAEGRLREVAAELERKNLALERSHAELLASWQQAERIFAAYAEILPGTEIDGRYRLMQRIGSGGYGIVYRAVEIDDERPVAVKLFRPANGRITPDHIRRFRFEGAEASRVNHPNAVAVFDSGVSAEGLPYIVMELLEGQTLSEALDAHGPLSPRRAVSIVMAVCDALAAAHGTGIVHRDVKPENVFLHRGDDGEVVKILDFGIAKLIGEGHEADEDTATGRMIGTPLYMSPERLRGEPCDGRSDVYSVGVMLFELIAGKPPFRASEGRHWDLVRQHLSWAPPSLGEAVAGVPAELDALTLRALGKDPSARPTAADLVRELRSLLDRGLSDEAAPAHPASRATVDLTLDADASSEG